MRRMPSINNNTHRNVNASVSGTSPSYFSSLETKRYYGHRTSVYAVTWNSDGSRLLSAGDNTNTLVYDTSRLDTMTIPMSSSTSQLPPPSTSASISTPSIPPSNNLQTSLPTPTTMSSTPLNSNMNNTNRSIHECRGHTKKISALLASPTSPAMLATAAFDSMLNIYDIRVGSRPVHSFSLPSACLYADWSPDGRTIGVGLASDTVVFVDCLSWSVRSDSKHFDGGDVNQFRWTSDSRRILFGRINGYADLLQWPSLDIITSFRGHVANCPTVACHPYSKYFSIASMDSTVSVWDAQSISNLYTIDRRDVALKYLAYSHNGKILAIAGDFDGVDLTNADNGSLLYTIPTNAPVTSIAWHPTHQLLAYSPAKSGRDRYSAPDTGQPICVWGLGRNTK